jgi:hypothetical protein
MSTVTGEMESAACVGLPANRRTAATAAIPGLRNSWRFVRPPMGCLVVVVHLPNVRSQRQGPKRGCSDSSETASGAAAAAGCLLTALGKLYNQL